VIDPKAMFERRLLPPFVFDPYLRQKGHWARAEGILEPVIRADRLATGRPGWNALLHHEALHCIERHPLVGILLLGFPMSAAPFVAAVFGSASGWGSLALGLALWAWWKREREIRADAFAWKGAGPQQFYSFVAMLPHPELSPALPKGWRWLAWARWLGVNAEHAWYRWVYGRTLQARIERARRRAGSTRWSRTSSSESPAQTAGSSSPSSAPTSEARSSPPPRESSKARTGA
jgi:hypothetical protein